MKAFPKDILIVDFEVTGFDFEKDESVQVGILLLDKKTLEEKKYFVSWIKPKQALNVELPGFIWANIKEQEIQEIRKASPEDVVAKQISNFLPDEYILCAWNVTFDYMFWKKILSHVDKNIHAAKLLDLWSLAQVNLLNDDSYTGTYGSESVFQHFGVKPREKHDGLEDCRIEAMVLRKLLDK
jgi:DNA polymerase III alpha subunit (gram-positive type)